MLHIVLSTVIALAFGTGGPAQRAGAGAAPAITGALAPFQFLVGSCWTGSLPNGATDSHCFESMYGGHFVRDRHRVSGGAKPYEGETLYRWDAAARVIRYTYYNSDGGVSDGTAHADGDALTFPEMHRDRAGNVQEYRNVWRQTSPDVYVALTEKRTPTGWEQSFKITFRRDRK